MILLLISSVALLAQADTLHFTAPQFLNSFYDHYTVNYLNAIAAGRGHTGAGLDGNIENSLQNPAAFSTDHSQFYFEIFLKPPIKEMTEGLEQNYQSVVPLGMLAYGYHPKKNLNVGFSYSTPQTIEYYLLSIQLQTDDYYYLYPSYNLHRLTATCNYDWHNLRVGLNLFNEIYHFKDITTWGTNIFDRVDKTDYALRFEPGIYYKYDRFSAGAGYLAKTRHDFKFQYQTFKTTLPSQLNAGIGYTSETARLAADMDLVRCSEMSDQFKDRYIIKAGFEKDHHKYTFRGGFMSVPSVWHGVYELPTYNANLAWNPYQDEFPQTGVIKSTGQSMVTGGFTWHSSPFDFTLSFIHDVQHNVNYTSVFGAMGINISKFTFKDIFPGDKKDTTPSDDDTEIEYLN